MILADAQPDAQTVNQAWLLINSVMIFVAAVAAVYAGFFRKTEKREVTFGFTPASKEEFAKHADWNADEHEKLWNEIKTVERNHSNSLDSKLKDIHGRVNGIEKTCGGLEESNEFQNNRLASMDAKLDRLIERKLNET